MQEYQGWITFEDLMQVLLKAKEKGDNRITVAKLSQDDDFNCEPAALQSFSDTQIILEFLKGKAKVIVKRLIIAVIPFTISADKSPSLEITLDALPS